MENKNQFTIGQMVKVTFGRIGQEPMVFESEIMDIACREDGVWVDHPELRGEDMLYVNLSNPHINKVEAIEEKEVKRSHDKNDIKEARKELQKAFKWNDEEEITISVKIYDCFEESNFEDYDDQQSYDVEIAYGIGEDYTDCVVTDSFYSTIEEDEVALKDAQKRAKAVLKLVKGWFDRHENITIKEGVEVYHA